LENRKQKWWRPKNGTPIFVRSQSHPIRNPFEDEESNAKTQRRKGARKKKPLPLGGFAPLR
jgi:hypothetical protein